MGESRDLPFYSSCVDWPGERVPALMYLIEHGVRCTRGTFNRHVDRATIPAGWEPCPAGTPYGEHFFSLPRTPRYGLLPVYWYVHSAVEFVFARPAVIDIVHDRAVEALLERSTT